MNEAFTNLRRFTQHSVPARENRRRVRKGVTPREIVYEEDRLKVYHYVGEGEAPVQNAPLFRVRYLVKLGLTSWISRKVSEYRRKLR